MWLGRCYNCCGTQCSLERAGIRHCPRTFCLSRAARWIRAPIPTVAAPSSEEADAGQKIGHDATTMGWNWWTSLNNRVESSREMSMICKVSSTIVHSERNSHGMPWLLVLQMRPNQCKLPQGSSRAPIRRGKARSRSRICSCSWAAPYRTESHEPPPPPRHQTCSGAASTTAARIRMASNICHGPSS